MSNPWPSIGELALTPEFLDGCLLSPLYCYAGTLTNWDSEAPVNAVQIETPQGMVYTALLDDSPLGQAARRLMAGETADEVVQMGSTEPEDQHTTRFPDGMVVTGTEANYVHLAPTAASLETASEGPICDQDGCNSRKPCGPYCRGRWEAGVTIRIPSGFGDGPLGQKLSDLVESPEPNAYLTEEEASEFAESLRRSSDPIHPPLFWPYRPEKGFSFRESGQAHGRMVLEGDNQQQRPKMLDMDFSKIEERILATLEGKRDVYEELAREYNISRQKAKEQFYLHAYSAPISMVPTPPEDMDRIRDSWNRAAITLQDFAVTIVNPAMDVLLQQEREEYVRQEVMLVEQEILEMERLRAMPRAYDDSTDARERLRVERIDRVIGRLEQRREELRMLTVVGDRQVTKAREIWEQVKVILDEDHGIKLRMNNPFRVVGESEQTVRERLRPLRERATQLKYELERLREQLGVAIQELGSRSDMDAEMNTWRMFLYGRA